MSSKQFRLKPAGEADIHDILILRAAVAEDQTAKFGKGMWSSVGTERGVRFTMTRSTIFIARLRQRVIAMLTLSRRKPWAIDVAYFPPATRPLYLTDMAVAPDCQRTGIGRRCIAEAIRIAREWPADAIRLDAFDAAAGAGEFYCKCGFHEVARVSYRGNPLIYFNLAVTPS
jgi:GNAT superfamily N-acetyltransferase